MTELWELDPLEANPIQRIKNAGYYTQRAHWSWESNCDYACFYCVDEGEITLCLNGEEYIAKRGDVIFLRSKDKKALLRAKQTDVAYYFVSFYYDEDVSLGILPVTGIDNATGLFKNINKVYHSETYLYKLKVAELFLNLVYALACATFQKSESYASSARLRSTVEYINANYYKKITIADLCAVSNYSPAHLRRLFLKYYGMPPQDYILNKKMSIVRAMVIEVPEKSIDEIAELLSFCSASYLCKLFKKCYGTSILEYKNAHL